MEAIPVILIASAFIGIVHAQTDLKNEGSTNQDTCSFNEDCKNVHMIHTVINNNVICCLNGQYPSVSIINDKVLCSCGSSAITMNSQTVHTMTPDEQRKFEENLHHAMEVLHQNLAAMEQRLHESLDGLGAKIAASVQKAIG